VDKDIIVKNKDQERKQKKEEICGKRKYI